jgi:hypothetical protein
MVKAGYWVGGWMLYYYLVYLMIDSFLVLGEALVQMPNGKHLVPNQKRRTQKKEFPRVEIELRPASYYL